MIGISLNSATDLDEMLATISLNNPDQIIIVDGTSRDSSHEVAKKYTSDAYQTKKGIATQYLFGLSKVKYNKLVTIESDHRYPEDFLKKLEKEFLQSNFLGLQAQLYCLNNDNFFEKGMNALYRIHQSQKGEKDVIGGPAIYHSLEYIRDIDKGALEGFSIDTQLCGSLRKNGHRLGLGETFAYQKQELNLKSTFKKFYSYGHGDYDFYNSHKRDWTLMRKLKSISHVFRRYVLNYPILYVIQEKKINAIPFFWLIAFFRYFGWLSRIFKSYCFMIYKAG